MPGAPGAGFAGAPCPPGGGAPAPREGARRGARSLPAAPHRAPQPEEDARRPPSPSLLVGKQGALQPSRPPLGSSLSLRGKHEMVRSLWPPARAKRHSAPAGLGWGEQTGESQMFPPPPKLRLSAICGWPAFCLSVCAVLPQHGVNLIKSRGPTVLKKTSLKNLNLSHLV